MVFDQGRPLQVWEIAKQLTRGIAFAKRLAGEVRTSCWLRDVLCVFFGGEFGRLDGIWRRRIFWLGVMMKRWRSAMIMMMTAVWPSKAGSTATPGVSKLQKTIYQTWTNLDGTYAARDEMRSQQKNLPGKVSWFNIGIPKPLTVRILSCVFWFKMGFFSENREEKSSENRFHLKCMCDSSHGCQASKFGEYKERTCLWRYTKSFPFELVTMPRVATAHLNLKSWATDVTTVRQKCIVGLGYADPQYQWSSWGKLRLCDCWFRGLYYVLLLKLENSNQSLGFWIGRNQNVDMIEY